MEIQTLPLTNLIPYARNAKTHPKEQIDKIAAQISSVGFLVPVVVDKEMIVIAGHGRLAAAKALGMEMIPVVVADHLTEDQAMAWRIADNKVAESPWDMQMLGFDLQTLQLHEVNLETTGFTLDDAKTIIASFSGAELPAEGNAKEGAQELGEEGFQEFQHKCPRCSFEFNDPAQS